MTTKTQEMRGKPVTDDEAEKSAQRLINSHFRNPDSAIMSIPVRADNDDVLIMDYIEETRALRELANARILKIQELEHLLSSEREEFGNRLTQERQRADQGWRQALKKR